MKQKRYALYWVPSSLLLGTGVHRISQWRGLHWWIQEFGLGVTGARAYTGGPGAEPLVRGSGAKPLKAGAFLGPGRP